MRIESVSHFVTLGQLRLLCFSKRRAQLRPFFTDVSLHNIKIDGGLRKLNFKFWLDI